MGNAQWTMHNGYREIVTVHHLSLDPQLWVELSTISPRIGGWGAERTRGTHPFLLLNIYFCLCIFARECVFVL